MELDIYSKIISKREDTNDYRLCLTREEIEYLKECMQHSDLVTEIRGLIQGENDKMLFMITQADHYKPFEDYGLPTMAYNSFKDEIMTDIDEIRDSEEVAFRFSEYEISGSDDLIKFVKKCGCRVVVGEIDKFYPAVYKKYRYEMKLYNNYLE